MRYRVAILSVLLAFVVQAAFADDVTINFDDVAGGTQVNNQYASQGLTLTCETDTSGSPCVSNTNGVYSVSYNLAHSGTNVLSVTNPLNIYPENPTNYIVGTFASGLDVTSISVWALPNCSDCSGYPTSGPTLQIFDTNGNYLNSFDVNPAGGLQSPTWEQITATSGTAIGSFSLYDAGDLYETVWDDLSYTTNGTVTSGGTGGTGGGGGVTSTPEPSSLMLLGSGILGLGGLIRRRFDR